MEHKDRTEKTLSHSVPLDVEDVLDQAVYENVWMSVGDNKETDVARLIRQGRIRD